MPSSPPGAVLRRPGLFALVKGASQALFSEVLDLVYPEPAPCLLCRGPGEPDRTIRVCSACTDRIAHIGRPRCSRCGRAISSRKAPSARSAKALTCSECNRSRQAFDYCRAYGVYEGYLRALIHQVKYGKDAAAAQGLGELMAWVVACDPGYGRIDAVVAVPLHPRRLAERGFNQAALLAERVAWGIRRPMVDAVARVQETSPQSKLPYSERGKNVRRAFAVTRPHLVKGKRILIVDDVLTTGATLSAVARALKRAGAARCAAVCAAAGSLDADFDAAPVLGRQDRASGDSSVGTEIGAFD